jgi:hypothetical protein
LKITKPFLLNIVKNVIVKATLGHVNLNT